MHYKLSKSLISLIGFVSKLAEHKFSFPGTDHIKKFIREYYVDSKSVRSMNDAVTETTCIAHDVLGSKYQQEIAAVFQIVSVVWNKAQTFRTS